MFDQISPWFYTWIFRTYTWCHLDKVNFYVLYLDNTRSSAITERFGIEMISIPMDENGPDMDLVEKYVQEDETVKGIWCVPQYSNPSGITYSDEVVERFAHLKPAAPDFRIFWIMPILFITFMIIIKIMSKIFLKLVKKQEILILCLNSVQHQKLLSQELG